ncbi:hypothetical protein WMY93_030970 [Mugilogobius chulae]|uniref:Uncharacterized protein n=1 Tax=Mugilogobius chulae TaxID=88201 RepID=A0AAW0MJT6_9GOBI
MAELYCRGCIVPMQSDNGHDLCPACLGIDHLQDGLAGKHGCMNCSNMPAAQRTAHLAMFEEPGIASSDTQPNQSSEGIVWELSALVPMVLSLLHGGVGSNVRKICPTRLGASAGMQISSGLPRV